MRVLVGSKNPVKIEAVRQAFSHYYDDLDVFGIEVDSGVPAQPIGQDTFVGAKNRALAVRSVSLSKEKGADFFVGVEGGIAQHYGRWFAFGCFCIMDRAGNMGYGLSPHFELPSRVTGELLNGAELGHVMDSLTGERDTKHKGGAIGFFTKGVMDRTALYKYGIIAALVPLLNKNLFSPLKDP